MIEGIEQRLGLQQPAAALRVKRDGVRAIRKRGLVTPHEEFGAEGPCHAVAELEHLAELVPGIDMEKRKWKRTGEESLLREAQHHGRVLAD